MCRMRYVARILVAFLVVADLASGADSPTPEQLEFFEKQVRPLLVQHCQECHGAKKQEAGLRLDTRAGFLKGSDSGPVIVAANIDGSRMWQVLKYADGDTQMPPKGKLQDEQLAIVRKWLELGSPWSEETAASDPGTQKPHWAFQPVKRPGIPAVSKSPADPSFSRVEIETPVDSFIAAALAEKKLGISLPASRDVFIRRATLDLWGIPPKFEQVREFVDDASPDAFERLIDRLLASPLYGQRWGRHWLDIARYADSKGYVFTQEPRYPYSYTYRDYVIDAFNADTPFDRFVTEQLAADLVVAAEQRTPGPEETNDPRLAALGFLTVGRRYLNNNNDIIDDRIDAVSRGLLGLTVGCARCHDHKFDPIPTADYYSLFGVFASTTEPGDLPVIGRAKDAAAYEVFAAELKKREEAVANFEKENLPKVMNEIRDRAGDCLQMVAKQSPIWSQTSLELTGKNEPRQQLVRRWQEYLKGRASEPDPVFGPWHRLATIAKADDFPAAVTEMIASWADEGEAAKVNPLVRQAIAEKLPKTLTELARLYGSLLHDVNQSWLAQQQAMPDAMALADGNAEQIRRILYTEGSPANVTLEQARRAFGRDIRDKITNLQREVDKLKVTSPGAPPRAMVVKDGPIQEPVIFIRGNPGRPGKSVPRQFLGVIAGSERKPFSTGSGRLELARAIVDTENPLTPRVIANRVWQHHFGTGLVPTPSDFGTRGLPPSHPELLDWLAAEMAGVRVLSNRQIANSPNRWSLKWLHRLVLNSSVYRQSSNEDASARAIDPEDRLLWRMPRLRLDFEALRDSMLSVSGTLDASLGGQPFDGVMNPSTKRRTIYAFVNRNDLPGVFRVFDFADIDSSAADRPQTTVPQQALFAMNSPFIQEQSRRIAGECVSAASEDPTRLELLYQRVLSRMPTSEERELGLHYLANALTTPTEKLSPWDRLAQVLLMTNEFDFVD